MKPRLRLNGLVMAALALGALSATGCGRLNRTATLGLNTSTVHLSGPAIVVALERQLAAKGLPSASVSCARTIAVHLGVTVKCDLSGAGSHHSVRFTFKNTRGEVESSSVKVTS
jgi:hypothetical protein